MSSIVIFIIFVVISMVFQAIKQENNKGKRPTTAQRPGGSMTPPTVAAHRNPDGQSAGSMQSSRMQPSKAPEKKMPVIIDEVFDPEGIQTEGPARSAEVQTQKIEPKPNIGSGHLDIDMDDLQRSIIMSEILGKPKALRKN